MVTGPCSSDLQASGAPIKATSAADTSAPICGRLARVHHGDGAATGLRGTAARGGSPPDSSTWASKRCSAASIAASRRAGRGGGGSGSDSAMSSSMAT
jgi:hypothetical protein